MSASGKNVTRSGNFFGPRNVGRSGQKQILTSTYLYVHTMNLKQANDVFFYKKYNFHMFLGRRNREFGGRETNLPQSVSMRSSSEYSIYVQFHIFFTSHKSDSKIAKIRMKKLFRFRKANNLNAGELMTLLIDFN